MPILVACPKCGAKLNAPDSAAGKKVRCPKPGCGTVVDVPAPLPLEPEFDEPQQAPPPPKPRKVSATIEDDDDRPRKKSRRADEDDDRPKSKRRRAEDDEDDDDDDWQRKKRKRRKAAGGLSPGVIAAIAVGGVLLLGGIGYGIYALVSGKSDSASSGSGGGGGGGGGAKAAVPAGWVEYRSDSDKFKAYFPSTPQAITLPAGAGGAPMVESVGMHMMNPNKGTGSVMGVIVLKFKPGTSAADKERAMAAFRQGMGTKGDSKISEPRPVTWAGQSAQEITIEDSGRPNIKTGGKSAGGKGAGVMRYMTTDTAAYIAIVGTENAGRAKPEEENGFFDNFELLK